MALGTADENGKPWVAPVYFASAAYREFYWISSPDVRHSRNIALRPQVSIVVFDSQIPIGSGQAVYMSALAEQVIDLDLIRSLGIYNGRFPNPAEHGVQEITKQDVLAPAPYRLYRATASEHWVLDPAGHPDHRTAVTV
jgi:nitroimidazol reductase NimA-like FMN-containing flavoprotein (pyridoxamine 5'-phosphate oxidase superfamily)